MRKKLFGRTTVIVDDDRHTPQRRDTERGARKQVPGPARICHHMDEVGTTACAPQAMEIRQQAKQGPHAFETRSPSRSIGRIDLNQFHPRAVAAQKTRQLLGKHGHAAHRRRQGANKCNAQAVEPHAAFRRVSRPYTGM